MFGGQYAEADRRGMARASAQTLGEAMELRNAPPRACACTGPGWCCVYMFIQAEALHRGAHIVAKLLADATEVKR